MSRFEVRLQFERGELEQRPDLDAYAGQQEDITSTSDFQLEVVDENGALPEVVSSGFQSSEERDRAIEEAMRNLGQCQQVRIVAILQQMIAEGFPSQQSQQVQLQELKTWLSQQLSAWQNPVMLPEDSDEKELAETFNFSLSQACDGLNLALELVTLLAQENTPPALLQALLQQVDDHFQQARNFLLLAQPTLE